MPARKKEQVSVSFHYLQRWRRTEDGDQLSVPFAIADFERLWTAIRDVRPPDLNDAAEADRVRLRQQIPLETPERVDTQTIFGRFRASYWGHAYDNSEKGKISADSISLRPFFYTLYFSESGSIYIGAQYLGQFGGYDGLRRTLMHFMRGNYEVTSHSFRVGAARYRNVEPKEVRVRFSDRSSSLEHQNVFGKSGVVAFKQIEKGDGFNEEVRSKLMPYLGSPANQVKRAVSELIRETRLMELDDSIIDDCTIIGTVNGRRRAVELIEAGDFASRFPMDVSLNADGHPDPIEARREILRILGEEIISRRENV